MHSSTSSPGRRSTRRSRRERIAARTGCRTALCTHLGTAWVPIRLGPDQRDDQWTSWGQLLASLSFRSSSAASVGVDKTFLADTPGRRFVRVSRRSPAFRDEPPPPSGVLTEVVVGPESSSRARNASCRAPCCGSRNSGAGPRRPPRAGTPAAACPPRSRPRTPPPYTTLSGRSRTGDPYRNPAINTYTSAACTASRHTATGCCSLAVK